MIRLQRMKWASSTTLMEIMRYQAARDTFRAYQAARDAETSPQRKAAAKADAA